MQEKNRENSPIKNRILQYLKNMGITRYECYKKVGLTNGILSQKNGISEENLLRFLSYYQNVNPDWLLTGKGTMLKQNPEQEDTRQPSTSTESYIINRITKLEAENEKLKKGNEKLLRIVEQLKNREEPVPDDNFDDMETPEMTGYAVEGILL